MSCYLKGQGLLGGDLNFEIMDKEGGVENVLRDRPF
jgi:hypothetical protein